jgi:outer membrane murein-binding lipoprotein Lpp
MKTKGVILAVVVLAVVALYGCKKEESSSTQPQAIAATVSDANAAIEQTTCPVMDGGAINKDIYTVYKGKKVYFCCVGCKPQFEKDPEKYIGKLPQFAK